MSATPGAQQRGQTPLLLRAATRSLHCARAGRGGALQALGGRVTGRIFLWVAIGLAVALGGATWLRCEGDAPVLTAPDQLAVGAKGVTLSFEATDAGSGLKRIGVTLRYAGGDAALHAEDLAGNPLMGGPEPRGTKQISVAIDPKALGLHEGDATLAIEARDWSWRGFFQGNVATREVPLRIDLTKPELAVHSGITYLRRGGSGAVAYRVGADTQRDGVLVADEFYPGHPRPGAGEGERMALFAIARNAPQSPQIRVMAEDAAGNRSSAGWQTNVKERAFEEARIDLSANFMANKVRELAEVIGADATNPLAAFQSINKDERARNEARVREIVVAGSKPELLYDGVFMQMRNSAVTSRFAEHRSYFLENQQVSEAIHYGFDLASLAQAPIEASNRGRVLFAGPLGIYGNCVILDHGMGLASLYAHLSRIDVKEGDLVAKLGVLGRSGATGLAGGDHLHFAMLIGNNYVDPTEWWDEKWVREKVEPAKQGGLLATAAPPAP